MQWYQTPILSQGSHNITLSLVQGASIDFVVVTTDNASAISPPQPAIVDDSDPIVVYSGSWTSGSTVSSTSSEPGLDTDVTPYANSTHFTREVGASVNLTFTGNGV